MTRTNTEIVQGTLAAWDRDDLDAWVAASRPDVEWYSEVAARVEGSDGMYRGHEGLRRYWHEWRAVWDVQIEMSEFREYGHTVLALGRVHARGEGSGVGLDGPLALVIELEDGLIRCGRAYFDMEQAERDARS
jgi:ketosteroid isomerase-like protein